MMLRLILAVIITIFVVAFVMLNTHHVGMSMIFGEPVKIRLIFLLLSTFALGVGSTALLVMVRATRHRRRPPTLVEKPSDLLE